MDTGRVTWLLDPKVTFLNHGSYGACPRPVLDAQSTWRERLEREPVRFMAHELESLLDEARGALARFIGAAAADVAFVPNATAGVNAVLRSLELRPGDELLTTDHEYNACRNAMLDAAHRSGARVVAAAVPFPIASPEQVVEAVLDAASARTRLAVVSHVTSPTALVFPVERIVAGLAERGIDTLVDGAHAPGMLPLDLARLGAAYYAGNCHKWLCAPKGSGFLHVRRDRQPAIRPPIVSHGANSPRADRSRFLLEFDWTGTADPTAYLATPAAIDFVGSLHPDGWPGLMAANHRLAVAGRDVVLGALGEERVAPDAMVGAMAAICLRADIGPGSFAPPAATPPGSTYPPDPLHDLLLERGGVQVPVYSWPGTAGGGRAPLRLLRISAQVYNSLDDFERLAAVLDELRPSAGD